MKILKNIRRIFLVLFLLFSTKSVLCEMESWGGVLPYAHYNGQAYLLIAFDSVTNNWDSFNCKLEEKDGLYEKVSLYAHFGTRGVFAASLNDLILQSESSEDYLMAFYNNGITFFKDCLEKTETINEKKEQTNFTCIIKHDCDDFLFFVEVPFIPARIFVDSFYLFQKVYKNYHNVNGFEYLRRTGFAWVKIQDLVNIIENRKKLKMNMARNIRFGLFKDKTFLAKTSQLKRRLPGNRIDLSSVLTAELSYDAVMDILKKIIKTTQFKWIAKSSNY